MPRVPVWDQNRTATAPLPVVQFHGNLSPEAAGGNYARAGYVAAHELNQAALAQRERFERVKVTEAVGQFTDDEFNALQDPEKGALRRRGKDAIGISESVYGVLVQRQQELRKGLDGHAGLVFDEWAQARLRQTREALARHEAAEGDHLDAEATSSALGAIQRRASAMYTQPDILKSAEADVRALVASRAKNAGWTPEIRAEKEAEVLGALHASVLDAIPDEHSRIARQYFEAHKGALPPEARNRFEKQLKVLTVREDAQHAADTIWADSGGDLAAALGAARAIDDIEVRDETERRVRERHTDEQAALGAKFEAAKLSADEQFRAAGEKISGISAKLWADLPSDTRAAFRRLEDERTKGRRVTWDDVPSDALADWYAYKLLPADQKATTDILTRFGGKLPREAVAGLINEQETYRDGIARGDAKDDKFTQTRTTEEQIRLAAKKAGILPFEGAPKEKQQLEYARFEEMAGGLIGQFEREKLGGKRKATLDEIRPLLDTLTVSGEVQSGRWYWNDREGVRVSELAPGDVDRFVPTEVPALERKKIEDALRRQALPVNDAAVLDLYRRKLAGLVGATP